MNETVLRRSPLGDKCVTCETEVSDYESVTPPRVFNKLTDVINYTTLVGGDTFCNACLYGCANCSDSDSCDSCLPGFIPQDDGSCSEELIPNTLGGCEDGFYLDEDKGKCVVCHSLCNTCDGAGPNRCNSCHSATQGVANSMDFMLFQNSSCRCPEGFFSQGIEKLCYPCDSSCKFCIGPDADQCVVCAEKGALVDFKGGDSTDSGACYNCSLFATRFPDKCDSERVVLLAPVKISTKNFLEDESTELVKATDPRPITPIRRNPRQGFKTPVPVKVIELLSTDEKMMDTIFDTKVGELEQGVEYEIEYKLNKRQNYIETLFKFNKDVGKRNARIRLQNANAAMDATPDRESL